MTKVTFDGVTFEADPACQECHGDGFIRAYYGGNLTDWIAVACPDCKQASTQPATPEAESVLATVPLDEFSGVDDVAKWSIAMQTVTRMTQFLSTRFGVTVRWRWNPELNGFDIVITEFVAPDVDLTVLLAEAFNKAIR